MTSVLLPTILSQLRNLLTTIPEGSMNPGGWTFDYKKRVWHHMISITSPLDDDELQASFCPTADEVRGSPALWQQGPFNPAQVSQAWHEEILGAGRCPDLDPWEPTTRRFPRPQLCRECNTAYTRNVGTGVPLLADVEGDAVPLHPVYALLSDFTISQPHHAGDSARTMVAESCNLPSHRRWKHQILRRFPHNHNQKITQKRSLDA
ncbi:hypothetical protein FN846DRAFT_979919 [Sphaerosporella brunnea]|uniref:Uncharacterized protein n=1 Tax=Sphaerosporella brunnea TaxID=1250544 RepID=A0A5J5ECY1_9PEZI|nr:hypothetical protein FN846DRAFT_979919 [Sphaerosporella brunnea]